MRAGILVMVLCLVACGGSGAPDAAVDTGVGADAGSLAGSDAGPPGCAVLAALDGLSGPGAGSEGYVPAETAAREALGWAIRALAAGDGSEALRQAALADYSVCQGGGAEASLVRLSPLDSSIGAPVVVMDLAARTDLVFEAPHPFFDVETDQQARAMFVATGARALLVSGTHRCASTAASGCDGSTSVCGSPAPYRRSDVAHDTLSAFHAAHVALSASFPSALVVSVHGKGEEGATLSDGTTDSVSSGSVLARFAAALTSNGATGVVSCNPGTSVPPTSSLCGTTNVQGRHLNGSPDACTSAAPSASGRFLHLEQSRALRREPTLVADSLLDALSGV